MIYEYPEVSNAVVIVLHSEVEIGDESVSNPSESLSCDVVGGKIEHWSVTEHLEEDYKSVEEEEAISDPLLQGSEHQVYEHDQSAEELDRAEDVAEVLSEILCKLPLGDSGIWAIHDSSRIGSGGLKGLRILEAGDYYRWEE